MKRTILIAALTSVIVPGCDNRRSQVPAGRTETSPKQTEKLNMDKQDYTASILVNQDPTTAFNAIKDFRSWWSEEIEGKTDQLNETFFYHYKDIHLCKMKLIEFVPDKRLVYQVVDNQFNFTKDKTEWIGTKLIFDITSEGNKTKIQFTHEGLVPDYECYNVCFDAWNGYIKKSLYNRITTGKGEPNPLEGEGFNAALAEKWKLN
jgi:hypothetical protein